MCVCWEHVRVVVLFLCYVLFFLARLWARCRHIAHCPLKSHDIQGIFRLAHVFALYLVLNTFVSPMCSCC